MALRDVVGQDKAVNILLRTLGRQRVASAYLFAGEQGIGKKFTALNLAKAVNCLSNEQGGIKREESRQQTAFRDPEDARYLQGDCCDECHSCRKIDSGAHPDLLLVTPVKGEIRIDEIRTVEEALLFKPFEGRIKVVIIDDADTMNNAAANAFLKTLEEPPDKSLLVLIASNPGMLPDTIISRCSRLNFVPLSYKACEEVIRSVCSRQPEFNNLLADGVRLSSAIRFSMGRPGLITPDILDERERAAGLFRNMLNGLDTEIRMERDEMERWFCLALTLLRDMIAIKISNEPGMQAASGYAGCEDTVINADAAAWISETAEKSRLEDMAEAYQRLSALRAYLDYNLNKAITWNRAASILRGVNASNDEMATKRSRYA